MLLGPGFSLRTRARGGHQSGWFARQDCVVVDPVPHLLEVRLQAIAMCKVLHNEHISSRRVLDTLSYLPGRNAFTVIAADSGTSHHCLCGSSVLLHRGTAET